MEPKPGTFVRGHDPRRSGGRPKKLAAVESAAREHTELAIATLAEICGNVRAPAAARVTAAATILDRGWGRARQDVNVGGTIDVATLTDVQLDTRVRADLAAFLGGLVAGNDGAESEGIVH